MTAAGVRSSTHGRQGPNSNGAGSVGVHVHSLGIMATHPLPEFEAEMAAHFRRVFDELSDGIENMRWVVKCCDDIIKQREAEKLKAENPG